MTDTIQNPPEQKLNETIEMKLPPQQPTPSAQGASGKAIAALITGILSIICCGFFSGIPAIILGKQELNAIKQGRSNPQGQNLAQIGFILGIIGTSLSCLGFIIYVLVLIFGASMGIMQGVQEGM